MKQTWFISDTHFFDSNIIKYADQSFTSREYRNDYIIDRWNKTIHHNDDVYVLGDMFCSELASSDYYPSATDMAKILSELEGYIYLVCGNHDQDIINEYNKGSHIFNRISGLHTKPIIFDNMFILSHEPIYLAHNDFRINVHGHWHQYSFNSPKYFNVSVENINYTPISKNQILEKLNK